MIRTVLVAAALSAGLAASAQAAGATGVWRTSAGADVELTACGAALCGKLLNSPQIAAQPGLKDALNKDAALRNRPLKGLQILSGFSGGPTKWTKGRVYNPEDGATYSGSIELAGDKLKLTGCAAPMLCRTQTWTRVR